MPIALLRDAPVLVITFGHLGSASKMRNSFVLNRENTHNIYIFDRVEIVLQSVFYEYI